MLTEGLYHGQRLCTYSLRVLQQYVLRQYARAVSGEVAPGDAAVVQHHAACAYIGKEKVKKRHHRNGSRHALTKPLQ